MVGQAWSLLSCCSRKQCDDTGISRVSKDCLPGCPVAQLPAHGEVRKITYLLRAYLALSKLALNAHKIIKGMRAGSNSAIKQGKGVEI